MKIINFAKIFADNKANIMRLNKPETAEILTMKEQVRKLETTDLNGIKGIGQATVKLLLENGVASKEELIKASPEKLKKMGINPLSLGAIEKLKSSL